MKVDLIIPTYKPGDKLRTSLERLSKQIRRPDRILLINTEEEFFPKNLAGVYDNVEIFIRKEDFDHGKTRDFGASLSDADIIMFMTDDAIPKDRYLVEHLIRAFEDESVAAAYGRQLADPKDNYIEYYTRIFNYPAESRKKTKADLETLGIKTFFCSNVCSAYRKSAYDAMGGFEHKTIFNEDMILASKFIEAGKTIAYVADAWYGTGTIIRQRSSFTVILIWPYHK
jgi:rhamnosyltransferase